MPATLSRRRSSLARWFGLVRPDLGLQRRIMWYVALGSIGGLAFFATLAHRSLEQSTQIIYAERLQLARLVAHEVSEQLAGAENGKAPDVRVPDGVQRTLYLHSLAPLDGRPMFHLSVIDGAGTLLAESHAIPAASNAEHQQLLREYLVNAKPGVVIHRPKGAPDKTHVVAYAPLAGRPGGVTLEQGRDAAMAIPESLQRHMGVAGVLFLAVGLGLAWFTTRQVTRPLTQLTAITRSIAAGDLSTPVPQEGRDEVRDLAASFETMRRQLRESHAELAQANRELERRVQERTRELELRHADLARTSNLLQQREAERTFLLQKTIQAQEEERRRVARDLHDAVGQFLSMMVVRLSVLERQAKVAAPELAPGLAELRSLSSHEVDEVRRLIVDLRPELLDDMGLPAALGHYAEQMLGTHGIAVGLDVDSIDRRLPPQVEVVVFRVVQEAITNILKHASASRVSISLCWRNGDLLGTVADNGGGFDALGSAVGKCGTGVGLIGMRERVALLGGTLQIESAPGQGTRLTFRVPVRKEGSA